MTRLIPTLLIACTAAACSSADFKALLKDVDTYHRDLVFERYEIAAKNIAPNARAAWLESLQTQQLRFAEIEVASCAPCASDEIERNDDYDPEQCAVIFSQVQWYVNGSPTVNSRRVRTVWQFNRTDNSWYIIEQN